MTALPYLSQETRGDAKKDLHPQTPRGQGRTAASSRSRSVTNSLHSKARHCTRKGAAWKVLFVRFVLGRKDGIHTLMKAFIKGCAKKCTGATKWTLVDWELKVPGMHVAPQVVLQRCVQIGVRQPGPPCRWQLWTKLQQPHELDAIFLVQSHDPGCVQSHEPFYRQRH